MYPTLKRIKCGIDWGPTKGMVTRGIIFVQEFVMTHYFPVLPLGPASFFYTHKNKFNIADSELTPFNVVGRGSKT